MSRASFTQPSQARQRADLKQESILRDVPLWQFPLLILTILGAVLTTLTVAWLSSSTTQPQALLPIAGETPRREARRTQTNLPTAIAPKLTIAAFTINGKPTAPKYLIALTKEPLSPLTLTWDVEGGKQPKVELLPAPGRVNLQGAVKLQPTQQVGTQRFTLNVTDADGQRIQRSIAIEVFDPIHPTQASQANQRPVAQAQAKPSAHTSDTPRLPPPH